jgi:hypothetical protein
MREALLRQLFAHHIVIHPVRPDRNVFLTVLLEALTLVKADGGIVTVYI